MGNINAPKIRFPDFKGDWINNSLGEIAKFSKGKGISKEDISESGETECIRYGELYTTYNETIDTVFSKTNLDTSDLVLSEANDIIIPASGETQIDIAKASCVLKSGIALGGDLNIIKSPNNGVFLSYYLNSKKNIDIAQLAQGISVVHLYAGQLSKLQLRIPSLPEQKKIASFFSAIDQKISRLKRKKILLEKYKTGVMQKIFSQEIRFRNDNGQEFPNWEKKRLGSIFKERNIQVPKSDEYPLMAFVAYKGVSHKGERYNREFLVNDGVNKKYKQTEYGDFIYSSNNLETGSIGLNSFGSASISPVYSIFQIGESCNPQFISCYLVRKSFINKMTSYRQGVVYGQWRIHESDFLKIEEMIPCIEEQTKIAYFLSAIDNKITHTQTQIEKAVVWKKGLMQQMFC
ncbi:MAG: restriction endonuclease subunit S [Bacteroidales bacterium]|jgi:type I restriction enzyme S subunit